MLESVLDTKHKTLNDKLRFYKQNIQHIEFTKILDQASITKGKALSRFWNSYTRIVSQSSFSCGKTDFVDSEWSSWNGCATNTIPKSWFTAIVKTHKDLLQSSEVKSSPKIYSQLLTSLSRDITEFEVQRIEGCAKELKSHKKRVTALHKATKKRYKGTSEEGLNQTRFPILTTRKIKLILNQEQRSVLNQWFGTVRWTYNHIVSDIRNRRISSTSLKELRGRYVNRDAMLLHTEDGSPHWALRVPYDIRDEALRDLRKAIKMCKEKVKAGTIRSFNLQFRSRHKDPQQSIVIHRKHWKNGTIRHSSFPGTLRACESLPKELYGDTRLTRTRDGRFYLCVQTSHPEPNVQDEHHNQKKARAIAIDPGVRTFMTAYDPSGYVYEWGRSDIARIQRLCYRYDHVFGEAHTKDKNKVFKWSSRKRKNLRRCYLRTYRKIQNLVREFHCKLTKWICENFSVVVLPRFNTSQMTAKKQQQSEVGSDGEVVIRRKRRILNSKSARQNLMLTWSHFKFRERLKAKSRLYPNMVIVENSEAYTTKTCSCCGSSNNVGGSKVFRCSSVGCGFVGDRDANAAKNIWLRFLTELNEYKTARAEDPERARKRKRLATQK